MTDSLDCVRPASPGEPIDEDIDRAINEALDVAERDINVISSADIEIRKFYFKNCSDRWGARVWCAVTGGPAYETSEQTTWTVYHRPNRDEQWPAKLVNARSFEEALAIGRDFVAAYQREVDHGE